MLKIDRQKFLENELKTYGSIIISEVSKKIGVSEETIRRDLKEMEKKNVLKRIHGGAYLPDIEDKGAPSKLRETFLSNTKNNISKYVIKNLINDKDSIILDSSTTCVSLAKMILAEDLNITIITNSLKIMMLFEEKNTNTKLISIGGDFRNRSCSFTGYQSTQAISNYVADKSFISCSAISKNHGLLDNSQAESQIRKYFIKHSIVRYLLIDHTKFDDIADYIINPLNVINEIITNKKPNEEWIDVLNSLNIKIKWIDE